MARRSAPVIIPVVDHVALAAMWHTTPRDIAARCRQGVLKAKKKEGKWYINLLAIYNEIESEPHEKSPRNRDCSEDQKSLQGQVGNGRQEDLRPKKKLEG